MSSKPSYKINDLKFLKKESEKNLPLLVMNRLGNGEKELKIQINK